jgi:hypothetical protein
MSAGWRADAIVGASGFATGGSLVSIAWPTSTFW